MPRLKASGSGPGAKGSHPDEDWDEHAEEGTTHHSGRTTAAITAEGDDQAYDPDHDNTAHPHDQDHDHGPENGDEVAGSGEGEGGAAGGGGAEGKEKPPKPKKSRAGAGAGRKSSRVLNCENCREKKMRCDRTNPCSPCALRHVECKWAVEPPDTSSAPSPLRQNAGEIARLRREIKSLALSLGLAAHELDAIEDDAEAFVRASEGSSSATHSTHGTHNAPPRLSAPKAPVPRKRPSVPLAQKAARFQQRATSPVHHHQAPPPPPSSSSASQHGQHGQQPSSGGSGGAGGDAQYYKRGFSTAGWGSWDRKGTEDPLNQSTSSSSSTSSRGWAAAPPGPRRFEATPGWAAPASGPPGPPPPTTTAPGTVQQPTSFARAPPSATGFSPPPQSTTTPKLADAPSSTSLSPPPPSLPSLSSIISDLPLPAAPSELVPTTTEEPVVGDEEGGLPPIRTSPPGSGEKRVGVALPPIRQWYGGEEGAEEAAVVRMEE
ncbi:hypothetical protein RQP46_010460 [Phenoliferia psychrophenolica]